jgi:hypothetical protein
MVQVKVVVWDEHCRYNEDIAYIWFCKTENPTPCEQVITINYGWNLISIYVGLNPLGGDYTASVLAGEINDQAGDNIVKYVVRWQGGESQMFDEYVVVHDVGNDFPINEGEGYYVWSISPFSIDFTIVGDCGGCEYISLGPCWNLVGWDNQNAMWVGEFAELIDFYAGAPVTQAIVRHIGEGMYQQWYPGNDPYMFKLRPGDAYWVFVSMGVEYIPFGPVEHVEYPDGTVLWIYPDGMQHWIHIDGIEHWIFPDGMEHWVFPDGTEHWTWPDGTEHWIFPDGMEHWIWPDGTEYWSYPDGTGHYIWPDGSETWIIPEAGTFHYEPGDSGEMTDGSCRSHYEIEITFTIGEDVCKCCEEYAFIQIVRITDKDGNVVYPNEEQEERATDDGWSIDRLSGKEKPYYGMNDDGSMSDGNQVGDPNAEPPQPAKMYDDPKGFRGDVFEFETYIICIKGPCNGTVIAGISWGFTINEDGSVTDYGPTPIDEPSDAFKEAREAWNDQDGKEDIAPLK